MCYLQQAPFSGTLTVPMDEGFAEIESSERISTGLSINNTGSQGITHLSDNMTRSLKIIKLPISLICFC